ncbi:MAG: TIGR00730 family Rossman fold protein [Gemmatimonadaceae bacterium]
MILETVCVFCAANPGAHPWYRDGAMAMGRFLAESGRRVVFGGGRTGLMGALAEGVLGAGGQAIGVMPKHLVDRDVAHTGLTELRVVSSMHERKTMLSALADGFVAMPGGLGTLEELFEIWTWGQLGLHRKPYGLLNVNGFFDPLLAFLDHAVAEGFVGVENRRMLAVDTDPERLIAAMESMQPPPVRTWIDAAAT